MVTIDGLSPCLSYWVVVTVIDCINRVSSPPELINAQQPVQLGLLVTVHADADNIEVTWRSRSAIIQQELGPVQVTVTSECPTGVVPPQTQVFTVTPDEGNSATIRELGM